MVSFSWIAEQICMRRETSCAVPHSKRHARAHILDRCVQIITRRQLDFLKYFFPLLSVLLFAIVFVSFVSLLFVLWSTIISMFLLTTRQWLFVYGVYSCSWESFLLLTASNGRSTHALCIRRAYSRRRCGLLWQRVGDRDTGNGSEGYIFYARNIVIETRTNMNETRSHNGEEDGTK